MFHKAVDYIYVAIMELALLSSAVFLLWHGRNWWWVFLLLMFFIGPNNAEDANAKAGRIIKGIKGDS